MACRVKPTPLFRTLLVSLAALCAGHTVQAAPSAAEPLLAQRVLEKKPVQETEVIRLRAGQLPEVSLSADILFRILASEIGAQRGVYGTSAATMLELARDTSDPRLARRALEFSLAGGNLSGALDAARYWALLAPNDMEASSTELALAAAAGQTQGLAEALRKRIDASPDKTAAIAQAMAVLGRMSDRAQALVTLDQALSEPVRKLLPARLALSDMAQAAGDSQRAADEARAALRVAPASEEAAQRVLEYGLRDDPERALADARAFTQRNPDARRLRLVLATQLSDRGDHEAALAELDAMARRAPEDFDLMFIRAQVLYRAKRLDQARQALQQFVDVQAQRESGTAPGSTDAVSASADAYMLLSRIAQDQGDLDEAVEVLNRVEDPSIQYSVRLRQAALRAQQGRTDEALALIDSAQPQDADEELQGLLAQAQLLRDAGRLDDAIALMSQADQANPDAVDVKYELAMLQERAGNVAEMERLLRQVIAIDPDHAHSYNALGYTLADRNERLPEALKLIEHALGLMPDDPFILDSMGWVKFRLNEPQEAEKHLRRAYALRPEAEIAIHLAEVLWSQGRRDEATALFREAAGMDADNKMLDEAVRRLGVKL